MDNEKLIDVINSLVGSCLTRETARKMVIDLVQDRKPPELTAEEKVAGIKELIQRKIVKMDEGLSFIRRVYEDQIRSEGYAARAKAGVNLPEGRPRGHVNKKRGYKNLFSGGSLRDALIRAISKGATSHPGITSEIAIRNGFQVADIHARVGAGLSLYTKKGVLGRARADDGTWRYEVLQFDSQEQKDGG